MEDTGAGATATTTYNPLPPTLPFDDPLPATNELTTNDKHETSVPFTNNEAFLNDDEPLQSYTDHLLASDVRQGAGKEEHVLVSAADGEAAGLDAPMDISTAIEMPETQADWQNTNPLPFQSLDDTALSEIYQDPLFVPGSQTENLFGAPAHERDQNQVQAYALLKFPDGDFYVKSFQVLLGRDMAAWEQAQKEKKRARKAQEAVEQYRQEPSQPSQRGDDDAFDPSSKSSQSLEGRPAKSLPSNLSETGGIMKVDADSDDELGSKRKKRKRRLAGVSKSSSTTSVAPANLHPNTMVDMAVGNRFWNYEAVADQPECVRVEVHPQNPEDMGKISREHLLLYFNFEEQRWDLEIKGNGAFVNSDYKSRGETVPLRHEDEVIFATVLFRFKLPDQATGDEEDVEEFDEEESELGVGRKRSQTLDEDEMSEAMQVQGKKKSGFKLKLGKRDKDKDGKPNKGPNLKAGENGKPELPAMRSPEYEKKPEKGKHPKKATKEPAKETSATEASKTEPQDLLPDQGKEDKLSETPAPPPTLPENIPIGSVFEGVKPEELPQKRKGPGRPPKNGLISKRDEGFIKRKRKEYEKRGEVAPPLDELVAIVRAENKEKERLAKLATAGAVTGMQPPSGTGEVPPGVVRSIEAGESATTTNAIPGLVSAPSAEASAQRPSDSAAPGEPARKTSPKPRRTVKSPSPQKPESSYTEDELKKPTQTYIFLIDEALRNHPTGIMDLQEIYDKICKRYPYYKYRAGTSGWQSSVRHNLISCERFVEAGKQGKGRLWKVNFDFPIDRDRKRREAPQDMPRPAMMANGQYLHPPPSGNFQGPPYPQQQFQGHTANYQSVQQQMQAGNQQRGGQYHSPYNGQQGPSGPNGIPHPNPAQGQPYPNGPPNGPPPAGQSQPPAASLQVGSSGADPQGIDKGGNFNAVVNAIMDYRQQYLRRFPAGQTFTFHEELFKRCTNFISNVYQGEEVNDDQLSNDEEKRVFADLKVIIQKFGTGEKRSSSEVQDHGQVQDGVARHDAAQAWGSEQAQPVAQSTEASVNGRAPPASTQGPPRAEQSRTQEPAMLSQATDTRAAQLQAPSHAGQPVLPAQAAQGATTAASEEAPTVAQQSHRSQQAENHPGSPGAQNQSSQPPPAPMQVRPTQAMPSADDVSSAHPPGAKQGQPAGMRPAGDAEVTSVQASTSGNKRAAEEGVDEESEAKRVKA